MKTLLYQEVQGRWSVCCWPGSVTDPQKKPEPDPNLKKQLTWIRPNPDPEPCCLRDGIIFGIGYWITLQKFKIGQTSLHIYR